MLCLPFPLTFQDNQPSFLYPEPFRLGVSKRSASALKLNRLGVYGTSLGRANQFHVPCEGNEWGGVDMYGLAQKMERI